MVDLEVTVNKSGYIIIVPTSFYVRYGLIMVVPPFFNSLNV